MKQTRIRLGVVTLFVAAMILLVVGCAGSPRSVGRIELSAADFDFGVIPNTGPVSKTFQVRNTGDGLLEISRVSTSCGCTTATLVSRRLAPGEATELTVTYDPLVHNGATGNFMRMVYVRSTDPETPEATLLIRVSVIDS